MWECRLAHVVFVSVLLNVAGVLDASESPHRECCDPKSPAPPPPTVPSTSPASPAGRSGPNVKTASATLNCLLARKFCFEDSSCSAILEIIPSVCGTELVACSTVTVTKCQAALRTLQAFPFFKPTCLCKERHVDPECSSFREFLFDHPCGAVSQREKDPYPVVALPTCNHALSVCQQEKKCIRLFEDFKTHCKVRDNKCRMEDRDLCHESWTNLRLSPIFGCICPNNHMKKRCDRIFTMVNHNPCVDILPYSFDLSGTDSALYPDPGYLWFPPTILYPYFLFPPTTSTAHASGTISTGTTSTAVRTHTIDSLSVERTALQFPSLSENVKLFTAPENYSNYQIKNPLIDASADDVDFTRLAGAIVNISDDSPAHMYSTGPDPLKVESAELGRVIFQSTCHLALDSCHNNYSCRMALQPILHHCDPSRCHRATCMEALQGFYRRTDLSWRFEIAFCLCKKTNLKDDECMVAQEKLHPMCAQRTDSVAHPTCHSLAENCKKDPQCREKLERYEQACAVDSVTKKCAGPAADCREAMLDILGTELRSVCACKSTDASVPHDCIGWQRLLWINPCVVESQKDFHLRRSTLLTTTSTLAPTKMTTFEWSTSSATAAGLAPSRVTFLLTDIPVPTLTTTAAPRFCVFQRPHQNNQYIKEGNTKRMHHDDELECSELCHCGIGEALVCHTICVDRLPCRTEFASYSHAAPAYQAYRGRCLCYSGRFICMKPAPGDYTLPEGVFLFLGYSETDEALLKPHSNLSVQDAVVALEELLEQEAENGTTCTLSLFNMTRENIILEGRVARIYEIDQPLVGDDVPEKDECIALLEMISEKINSQHADYNSHPLLSIFKMAEVEVVQASPTSSGSEWSQGSILLLIILVALLS